MEDVVGWLRAERAEDVRALSVSGLLGGAIGEHLLFATGRSRTHMSRIARAVQQEFKAAGVIRYGQAPAIEGQHSDDWLLVDGGDVVVSIMEPSARASLSLEDHWQTQGAIEVELPPDELISSPSVEGVAMAASMLGAMPALEANVPTPPASWGVSDVSAPHIEAVYREDGDIILDDDAAAGPTGKEAADREAAERELAEDRSNTGNEYNDDDYDEYSGSSVDEYSGSSDDLDDGSYLGYYEDEAYLAEYAEDYGYLDYDDDGTDDEAEYADLEYDDDDDDDDDGPHDVSSDRGPKISSL